MSLLKGTQRIIGRTKYESEGIRLRNELEAAFEQWKETSDSTQYDQLAAAFNARCGSDDYLRETAIANAIKS